MVAICGLEMSDTKLSPPSRSVSTNPPRTTSPPQRSSSLANQNLPSAKVIETNNPLIKWARDLKSVLEGDKTMSRQFQNSPNIFMNNLARVNVDIILKKAIDLNRNITQIPAPQKVSPIVSPTKVPNHYGGP